MTDNFSAIVNMLNYTDETLSILSDIPKFDKGQC